MKDLVKKIDWNPRWTTGAPCPQVYSNEYKTFLIYYTDNYSISHDEVAIVEFFHASSYKFGIVNDEAISGHPLYKKGLDSQDVFIIENSSWIEEIKSIHKAHDKFNEAMWLKDVHFIFTFHDSLFEVIAHGYKIDVRKSPMNIIALEIVNKINGKD